MKLSATNHGPLWLELKVENLTRVFEFGLEDDRVVVVGSLLRADVRLDRAGVAPIHFQLERVAGAILLTPVYGRDHRLNGEHVSEPRLLKMQSMLEFADVRLNARVFERLPRLDRVDADRTEISSRLAARWLPDEDDTTIVAAPSNDGRLEATLDSTIVVMEGDSADVTQVLGSPMPAEPAATRARAGSHHACALGSDATNPPAPAGSTVVSCRESTTGIAVPKRGPSTYPSRCSPDLRAKRRRGGTISAACLLLACALVALGGVFLWCFTADAKGKASDGQRYCEPAERL